MELNEYQKGALKTCMGFDSGVQKLVYASIGLGGEAGEVLDLVKKYVWHGHPIRAAAVAKELGDVLWYVAVTADAIGLTLEEVATLNLDKLAGRYPEGFNVDRSVNRED